MGYSFSLVRDVYRCKKQQLCHDSGLAISMGYTEVRGRQP
jgi:hypothetical protein